ncbi:amino acid ABC transporter membrane protein 1 (PAAT family) [Paraburkholderia sp. BL27I4N3]|uniref:amino acid ABC transporter permease n=1 Tax=Paraburkholderia sp. BL27I4N3 TaxID=1938805 RepID=UPI000E2256C1|nr:amino acid ABC transporter permease [Paraburkholderia sp. BL27I4N3]REE18144.1 amino acid ABC transporter membrane protein 1 (PAAT family) [Paraburkholderia sp. BL27I4N3]
MFDLLQLIARALVGAIPWTIALTVLSFFGGAILAIPLCAMRVSHVRLLNTVALSIILTLRSIPPIVWLFFMFFGIGSGLLHLSPFVSAVLGLALITAGNVAEIYRGALKAVPAGQFEAAKVLGLSSLRQYSDVLGPQIFRVALPSSATYAIGLLKDTAVASTIGVPELASAAYHVSMDTFKGIEVYATAGVMYFFISIFMAWSTRALDKRLRLRIAR